MQKLLFLTTFFFIYSVTFAGQKNKPVLPDTASHVVSMQERCRITASAGAVSFFFLSYSCKFVLAAASVALAIYNGASAVISAPPFQQEIPIKTIR